MSCIRFLIWSFEHQQWWAPARCGYTSSIKEAGRYSVEEATGICADANAGGQLEEAMVPDIHF